MPKGNTETIVPHLVLGSLNPLPEVLVRVPLPFPGEIDTAAVSHVTMRAHGSLGGGWSTKDAR